VSNTKKILTTFLRRLVNLTANNRSLFLPRLSGDHFIDLHELSQLEKEKSFAIIEALIARKKKIVSAIADPRMEAVNQVSRKLKHLKRLDHFLYDERGSRDLHLAWPFVRGKFTDGTLVRCPLLFFPVEIIEEKNHWVIKLRDDADITFNKSFLLAYSFYQQQPVDESLQEETFEDADRDSTVFRTYIYQVLQKSSVDINFNPDNFRDELESFKSFKKDEFEKEYFEGQLKLFPEAVLGIFPQSGSYLIPDYTSLIENENMADLESFFASRTQVYEHEQTVKEEKMFPAFAMDAWQEHALKTIKNGNSLVVQGPPGTGKSQLICNLIADSLAHGKIVLLVSQKRAALDVVYDRLSKAGMDDFVALVHDFKNDRKDIYRKMAAQVDRIDDYKARNISIDSIQLERKFIQTSRAIDQITEELEEFKRCLFDDADCGFSAKELYLLARSSDPVINVKQEFSQLTRQALQKLNQKLTTFIRYAAQFKVREYLCYERKSFSQCTLADWKETDQVLKEIIPSFLQVQHQIEERFNVKPDWYQCEEFWSKQPLATELLQLLQQPVVYRYFTQLIPYPDEETSSLWLANCARLINDCYEDNGVETSLRSTQLGDFQLALQKAMNMRKHFFGRMYWGLFVKERNIVKRALVTNKLSLSKDGLLALERQLDNRLNLEHNLSKLKGKNWLIDIPEEYDIALFNDWFSLYQKAIRAKLIFNQIRGLKNFINPGSMSLPDFRTKMEELYGPLYELNVKKEHWLARLLPIQIERIATGQQDALLLSSTLRKDFDALCECDRLEESFSPDEHTMLKKLYDMVCEWNAAAICALLNNSVYMAWLDYLETKYPVLRIPSSGRLFNLETELRELIEEKEKISIEILLLRAREKVIEELEFNRLNNRITYRDLHHQVTKKKKIWPVRRVISEFEDEVFKLLPCWMVSPEVASAIFPLREMFDLVIFDEASQCFAEQGIPALYRARQVLIAGDSQQLQPSDLYRPRWQNEDDDTPDAEALSLLDLSGRYLKSIVLKGHYRSKSMALIEFSNRHFYDHQLRMLPDRHTFNGLEPSIEYHKVEGVWEAQSNLIEAEHVANLVLSLYAQHPNKEIGVVTFNAVQQTLIQDLLDYKVDAKYKLPKSLFVKNIENVQGDERDIIIFSVGYARDKRNKLNAQFGTLNISGGENRLNVAITRAREKVIVVASIWPQELQVENTLNNGPKLLKEYLQYAKEVSEGGRYVAHVNGVADKAVYHLKRAVGQQLASHESLKLLDGNWPFADLVVKQQEEYIGALLTDDIHYAESLTAKAWHAQIPRILQQKNWKFNQLYSRNFWLDPHRFSQDLDRFFA